MPFKKGQSGNPGGRPKKGPADAEIEALAQKLSPEALETLAKWMRSDNAKASVGASLAIINRGHGTPAQTVVQTITDERTVIRAPTPSADATDWQKRHTPLKPH